MGLIAPLILGAGCVVMGSVAVVMAAMAPLILGGQGLCAQGSRGSRGAGVHNLMIGPLVGAGHVGVGVASSAAALLFGAMTVSGAALAPLWFARAALQVGWQSYRRRRARS